jgi:hypothetical protein
MTTSLSRTRGAKKSVLDGRIDLLNENAIELPLAQQIFSAVANTLFLVKVRVRIPFHLRALTTCNKDKMVNDEDAVQLSEYCFGASETVKAAVSGKNSDDLNESVKMALDDLRRYSH